MTNRLHRSWRLGIVAAIVALLGAALPGVASGDAPPPPIGTVRLYVPARETTVGRFRKTDPVDFAQAIWVTTHGGTFEIRARRDSYSDPIVATKTNALGNPVTLSSSLLRGFYGIANAVHIHVTDDAGRRVADYDTDWCPNSYGRSRLNDNGPSDPVYPDSCGFGVNPFTKGAIFGLEQGWASSLSSGGFFGGATGLRDGHYRVTATWNSRMMAAFGIGRGPVTVGVRVASGLTFGQTKAARTIRREATAMPIQNAADPDTVPDLVALPSWGISISNEAHHDYLDFGATVWDAGPAPLVVEGFRRPASSIMDGYQYFYQDGVRIGRAKVGTMEYDPRPGHQHWHFHDFAVYQLLDHNQQNPVKSGKEAFCLANTDAIDMLVTNAGWRTRFDDLGSVCGDVNSIWIRETLNVGYGDTYDQSRPGQAFDITNVPNGTYYIRITANPLGRLQEVRTDNNESVRQVILGGKTGARTVTVPPFGTVDSG